MLKKEYTEEELDGILMTIVENGYKNAQNNRHYLEQLPHREVILLAIRACEKLEKWCDEN